MKKVSIKLIVMSFVMAVAAALLPASQTNAASGCVTGTYRQGSRGDCVRYIQSILTYNTQSGRCGSVNTATGIDGAFGPKTLAAVKALQGEYCLVKDGIVGPNTWRTLCTEAFYTRVASRTDDDRAWVAGLRAGCATMSGMSNYCYSNRWCMHA